MTIPNSPAARKRNREVEEDQGGNAEKKGKAVPSGEPQGLGEPAMPRLTPWRQHLGSTSRKSEKLANLKRMIQHTTQQHSTLQLERSRLAKELNKYSIHGPTPDSAKALQLKHHIVVKDLTSQRQLALIEQCQLSLKKLEVGPDDMGSPGYVVREAVIRYLVNYIRDDKHKFVQGQIAWDVGEGQCLAFCLEYVQLRRASILPGKILPHMRDINAKTRISTVHEAGHASFDKLRGLFESRRQQPTRDSLFTASLTHDLKRKNDDWLSAPFNLMQHSLQTSIGYPSNIVSKALKRLHFFSTPDFSLECLAMLWPSWKSMLPELAPYSLTRETPSTVIGASSSSSSAPAQPQATLADKDLIAKDLAAYKKQFASLDHTRFSKPDDPYILLTLMVGGSGTRNKASGHLLVLDMSRESPGIFDPNFGFLAVYPGAREEEIRWLLSLLFMAYEVTSLDTWGVQ